MATEEVNVLPERIRSASYLDNPRTYENFKSGSYIRNKYNNDETFYTPRKPQERLDDPSANIFDSESNNFKEYSSYFRPDFSNSSVHDIVHVKNTAERIAELERTNLKLRRMVEYASIDKLNERQNTPREFESNRTYRENLLGPPVLRQGRIGSSWRHIKQTNNYSNSNFLFIDGTVRIDDSARYPPGMYGYPPKIATHRQLSARLYQPQDRQQSARSVRPAISIQPSIQPYSRSQQQDLELIGLGARSMTTIDLPVNSIVKNRPLNVSPYENQFHVRAKEGFEYWSKDKRYPENNKPKAETIAIGHPYFKSGY